MTRAAPQRQVCPKCLGTSAAGQGPCPLCQDSGYVQSEPELDRQKLALELGQLIEKKGGLIVQQNNLAATLGGTAPGSLEQLQQAVGDLLFGGPPGDRKSSSGERCATSRPRSSPTTRTRTSPTCRSEIRTTTRGSRTQDPPAPADP